MHASFENLIAFNIAFLMYKQLILYGFAIYHRDHYEFVYLY